MSNEKVDHPQGTESSQEKHPTYKVQIDKTVYEIRDPTPTGLELLTLAGKVPPAQFALYEKQKVGPPLRIALDQRVDLREPGIEKFVTLPLDQTEGLGGRRDFVLPADDLLWLDQSALRYELVAAQGVLRVVVYDFPIPRGYNVDKAAVNVRIEAGYPDAQIDMAYFFPALTAASGRAIPATSTDNFDGKTWQRWSRHRTGANPWRPGVDNLSTHFALIESWLVRELAKA
jgi:hypothetical protein